MRTFIAFAERYICRLQKFKHHYSKNKLKSFCMSDIQFENNKRNESLTRVRELCGSNKDDYKQYVEEAKDCLLSNGVIGVPTDTIYGLAALAQSTAAVEKLYTIKQRNAKNPIAICVADIKDIDCWSHVNVSQQVLEDLLPGAVTVVFRRKSDLNPTLNPHTNLIGVRIPDCAFMRDVSRLLAQPIALTSANISQQTSTICAKEFSHLWPELDMVFIDDLETNPSRLGSTVIDLSQDGHYYIIRPGRCLESIHKVLASHGLKERMKAV